MRAKGTVVIDAPLIALIGVTSASLALQHNDRQERQAARTASAVTTASQQVLADAVNAETGARGYPATGDPLFLQPYCLTLTRIAQDRTALRAAAVAEEDLTELGQPLDSFMAGYDHGADPAPRTVPAP